MEAECLTKNLSYLNLNISRTKNGKSTRIKISGFPNWGRLVGGGQFGQNGQKMHENDKISIFGSKQWEGHGGGGPSQFFG